MSNAFQEAADQLHSLAGDQMRQIQRRALRRVGEIVQLTAQFACPVRTEEGGGLLKPGELRASIKPQLHIATDLQIAQGDGSRVTVGPVGETARTVERFVVDGHVARGSKKKAGAARFIPGNPFMDRAFDESHQAAEDAYFESVTEDLEKALP